MVDVHKALKDVSKKGNIIIGEKQTKAALQKGTAKLVIFAQNCPNEKMISALAKQQKISTYSYQASGVDLGYKCGKNYSISCLAVLDEGESNILQLVKRRK